MRPREGLIVMAVVSTIFFGILWLVPRIVGAHCDTMDGPVVITAKMALEKGDVTPVLKWVKKEHEGEIRNAFEKTLAVRVKGPEAKELADMYFFETLIRLHRAGENAPYTGLKPAGTDLGPAVAGADKALESGSVEEIAKLVTEAVSTGIHQRFHRVMEKKTHADESVDAGREFVEAYIEFVHYVERVYLDATGETTHTGESEKSENEEGHHH